MFGPTQMGPKDRIGISPPNIVSFTCIDASASPSGSDRLAFRDLLNPAQWKPLTDRFLRATANPAFIVFSVYALCLLFLVVLINKYAISLPFADEYNLVSIACNRVPYAFKWLCAPSNEHRTPLLWVYIDFVGNLVHWDFKLIHKVNIACLGLGVFSLLLAVRKIRGRFALEDCFLPLVLLSPSLYVTVIMYAFAYTPVLGWLCFPLALVVSGAIYRSKWACAGYFLSALALLVGGGPAGLLWFVGLMCAVPFLWVHPDYRRWRYAALFIAVAGLAISALFIYAIPKIPYHEQYRSSSWVMTARLAFRHSFAWAGYDPLTALWPYLGGVILIPYGYVALRGAGGLAVMVRQRSLQVRNAPMWMPIAAVGIASLVLCVVLGYTRGTTFLWNSRYHCMLAPIAAVVYLLLVRFDAPRILPGQLTVVMLVCTGWTWHATLSSCPHRAAIDAVLRNGDYPLCYVSSQSHAAFCMPAERQNLLIESWLALRQHQLSVFHNMPLTNPAIAMHPSKGIIDPSIEGKSEEVAVQKQAIQLRPGAQEGRMSFSMHLPVEQEYQVWIRCRSETDGEMITVRIDGGEAVAVRLLHYPTYVPVKLQDHLALGAGDHTLELTLQGETTRVDFVEVVKKP